MLDRRVPPRWSEAGESGSKLLYQPEPEPEPEIYIVPIFCNESPFWGGCLSSLLETTEQSLLI